MQIESFYEIELKALLKKEQYEKLSELLQKEYTKINDDVIHSTRYRPGDIRLRYSNRIFELVHKSGDPTCIFRKETKMSFDNKEDLDKMKDMFDELSLQTDPPWIKHKQEFEIELDGSKYTICLQDIKDFSYILEVEYLSDDENYILHERNIRSIFKKLKVEPIDPKDFNDRISRYIVANRKWL